MTSSAYNLGGRLAALADLGLLKTGGARWRKLLEEEVTPRLLARLTGSAPSGLARNITGIKQTPKNLKQHIGRILRGETHPHQELDQLLLAHKLSVRPDVAEARKLEHLFKTPGPTTTVRHGTSQEVAEQIAQHGPKSPLLELRNLPVGRFGKRDASGLFVHYGGQSADTAARLRHYAEQAAQRIGSKNPALLEFEFPTEALRRANVGYEAVIPESLWPLAKNIRVKQAQTQYRDRVEVYGVTPGGKILGGLYDDQSIGVYGGGVDPGETPLQAGKREYLEEAGRRVHDLAPIGKPYIQPWLAQHETEKQRQRQKEFPGGSRTFYLTGRLGRRGTAQDLTDTASHLQDVKLRPITDIITQQNQAIAAGGEPEDLKRMRRRLAVLQTIQKSLSEKNAQAFAAPGIPKDKAVSKLPRISRDTQNRWVMAVQEHKATRAGRHFDLRLVDPDAGKAHSWAIPKAKLPEPGQRQLAIQTFTHTPQYALHFGEKKPQTIGKGYGKGTVQIRIKKPVDIIEADNDKVRFTLPQRGQDVAYLLRRMQQDKWLLQNVTRKAQVFEGK